MKTISKKHSLVARGLKSLHFGISQDTSAPPPADQAMPWADLEVSQNYGYHFGGPYNKIIAFFEVYTGVPLFRETIVYGLSVQCRVPFKGIMQRYVRVHVRM